MSSAYNMQHININDNRRIIVKIIFSRFKKLNPLKGGYLHNFLPNSNLRRHKSVKRLPDLTFIVTSF